MLTSTLPGLFQSTAVSQTQLKSESIQKPSQNWKFYSLSNSVAKIKLEKQNTFNGKNN